MNIPLNTQKQLWKNTQSKWFRKMMNLNKNVLKTQHAQKTSAFSQNNIAQVFIN